jgi:hypothetical protein
VGVGDAGFDYIAALAARIGWAEAMAELKVPEFIKSRQKN